MKGSIHTVQPSLRDKRVLITGGTTGIGRAIGNLLGSEGARIFICGRHEPELRDALSDMHSTGAFAEGTVADLAYQDQLETMFDKAVNTLGGLDILIDNAAVAGGGLGDKRAGDNWRYIVDTNISGYIGCAQKAISHMRESGGGHIVLIGSMSAEAREAGSSIYVATKAATQGFAESLRKEVNVLGIKVSLVEPGSVGSDMQDESASEQRRMIRRQEMLRAEDIAVAVHYILTQPERCDVIGLQIRPHLQLI